MTRFHNGWRGLALIALASAGCWYVVETFPGGSLPRVVLGIAATVVMFIGAALVNGYAYGRNKR